MCEQLDDVIKGADRRVEDGDHLGLQSIDCQLAQRAEVAREGHPHRVIPPVGDRHSVRPVTRESKARGVTRRIRTLIRAIEANDEARIEEAVIRLSSRRGLAPLALAVGTCVLLFDGLKLLISEWRLMLIQILPAMWIWLAMFDLKVHVLHGRSFHVIRGPILIPIVLTIAAITATAFFLNAVFALAVARNEEPDLPAAVAEARSRQRPILISGAIVGIALGVATMVVTRWGHPWFGISLSVVVGIMMLCYVVVPARLMGIKSQASRRDKVISAIVGGALGATICTPPYLLGRVALLMLGSKLLLIPGVVILAVAVALQAGTSGAVRAVTVSASLIRPGRGQRTPAGH